MSQAAMGPVGGQQLAGQARSYVYDSISRLTSTVTPESSTTTFYYTTVAGGTCSFDPSNVCRRVDARNITTTYTYDGLGRLGGVSYSDGTPTVTYTYGASTASNNNGRLITLAGGAGSESYTYNNMGWITNVSKVISGTTYNLVYAYNGLGQLTDLTYPSGRIVTQGLDAIGRLSSISSGATTYLSSPTYNAAGETLGFTYGNGVAATFTYNQRLQLASLRYVNGSQDLLNLAYEYGTGQQQSNNSGQIRKIRYYTSPNVEDTTKTQTYEYDAWARLRRAYTTDLTQPDTWRLEWDYDRFGNRRNQSLTGGQSSITQPQLTISETTNRITTAGYVYDAAGNLTNDSLHTYTYDAENRIKTVDGTAATYTYSGPMRVKKVQGSTTTAYIFSGSKVIAEYANGSLTKEYVYSGSSLLATHSGSALSYHHPDHLSTRVETDGTTAATVRTFGQYPFGEAWYETGTASKWKFTSYERDAESGLDQAIFRYNSPRLGRFMTTDRLGGFSADPQSMNRYTYTRNDPINSSDSAGLWNDCLIDGIWQPCILARPDPFWGCFFDASVHCPAWASGGPGAVWGCELADTFGDAGVSSDFQCAWQRISLGPNDQGRRGGIQQAVDEVIRILSGDNDCANFFNRNVFSWDSQVSAAEFFGSDDIRLYPGPRFAVGDTQPVAAKVAEQNKPVGSTIFLNLNGAFFNDRAPKAQGGGFTNLTIGGFSGNSLEAQVTILLHELGHTLGIIPSDSTSPSQSTENTQTILERCEDEISPQ